MIVGRREVADALGAALPGAQGPYVPLHLGLPLPLAIVTYLRVLRGLEGQPTDAAAGTP